MQYSFIRYEVFRKAVERNGGEAKARTKTKLTIACGGLGENRIPYEA
jgi:hypothetical protein